MPADDIGLEDARQHRASRGVPQAAQGPQDSPERCDHPDGCAHAEIGRGHVQEHSPGAHSPDPPGAKTDDEDPAVADRAEQAEHAADAGEDRAFQKEQAADRRGRKADGLHRANLAHALLDAQAEEQRGQEHRGGNQEEAEVDEVLAEVGRSL